ncbi:hypothetical protein SBY92_003927 [Candida maltosa Xu316]|uniref:Mitochondrial peculiar membrane protein n=1 Tax=Candida maltosa (strain Xu316) TaxID=1245528 RepID=M3J951_CANMX|nr:hypothetical protein G210_0792 [Candida maltosa Xu316]
MSNKKDQSLDTTNDNHTNDSTKDLVESFDDFVSNLGVLTDSIYDVSKQVGRNINEKTRDFTQAWFPRKNNDENVFNYPSFYQDRSYFEEDNQSHPIFGELWNVFPLKQFGDFTGSFQSGSTPFGYYSYKGPSIRYYHECLDKKGQSVWDEQGYWRCLFPNSEVPIELLNFKNKYLKGEILTKDDFTNAMKDNVQAAKDGVIDLKDQGIFFNSYDKFLGWKHTQYEEQVEKRKQELKNQLSKAKEHSGDSDFKRTVVSTSMTSNRYTDSETNEVKLVKVKTECDAEGNCIVTKTTKSKPIGALTWANVEENVEHVNK